MTLSDCGCTLLEKTHEKNEIETRHKQRGLLIIRNPFSAIRSYRNYVYGGLKGGAPDSYFVGKGIFLYLKFKFKFITQLQ